MELGRKIIWISTFLSVERPLRGLSGVLSHQNFKLDLFQKWSRSHRDSAWNHLLFPRNPLQAWVNQKYALIQILFFKPTVPRKASALCRSFIQDDGLMYFSEIYFVHKWQALLQVSKFSKNEPTTIGLRKFAVGYWRRRRHNLRISRKCMDTTKGIQCKTQFDWIRSLRWPWSMCWIMQESASQFPVNIPRLIY